MVYINFLNMQQKRLSLGLKTAFFNKNAIYQLYLVLNFRTNFQTFIIETNARIFSLPPNQI
jgi:hypothetical protein